MPRRAAVQLARATLILAWHTVRTEDSAADLLLGACPAVSEILKTLPLSAVDRIVDQHHRHARPRWEDRPGMWLHLLVASQKEDIRGGRDVNLRGLKLIAGELLSGTNFPP